MHSHDNGKGRFKKLIANVDPARPKLPLVHSTDAYLFNDALDDGRIEPKNCDVFVGDSLLYTFYGRPSYKPNHNENATGLEHYLPVCLIFKQSFSEEVRRVFPFDTGAFVNDFYLSYLHKEMKLGDFALEADLETPGRVISTFFGSARNYLMAEPDVSMKFAANQFEAKSYAALIETKNSNAVDSRCSGIEVQIADSISIEDWVDAVILPSSFADSAVSEELSRINVNILPYQFYNRMAPNEYSSKIFDKCIHYYISKGMLPEVHK